ncbi:MAG: T9SS type A sorting domain-containing protein [bacterium]
MNSLYKNFTFLFVVVPSFLLAQNEIPNSGFEDWSNGNPQSWGTTNIQGQVTNVTQSTDAHGGASAVRGEVVEFNGVPFSASIFAGVSPNLPFPVSQNYARLSGFYQFEPAAQSDILGVSVNLLDSGFSSVAIGVDTLASTNGSYAQFVVELDYSAGASAGDAAFASIQFAIGGQGTIALGTFFLVDDLQFEGVVTSIGQEDGQIPDAFTLQQNYPNPFNPSTTFAFTIPKDGKVKLTVFDLLGREVARVVDERLPAGSHSVQWQASNFPSGAYYYKLTAGEFTNARKLILLK